MPATAHPLAELGAPIAGLELLADLAALWANPDGPAVTPLQMERFASVFFQSLTALHDGLGAVTSANLRAGRRALGVLDRALNGTLPPEPGDVLEAARAALTALGEYRADA